MIAVKYYLELNNFRTEYGTILTSITVILDSKSECFRLYANSGLVRYSVMIKETNLQSLDQSQDMDQSSHMLLFLSDNL